MKFSSSLKFNAVAEWWDEYIAYDTLKKTIYQLEKQQQAPNGVDVYSDLEANETSALVGGSTSATDGIFVPLLDRELKKINLFYESQEEELNRELEELEALVHRQEAGGFDEYYADEDDDRDSDEDSVSRSREPPANRRRRASAARSPRNVSSQPSEFAIPEEPRRERGYSMSSDENNGEMEASTVTLGGTATKRALGRIATRVRKMSLSESTPSATSPTEATSIWNAHTNFAYDTRLLFKRRITTLYVAFTSLRSYVEVNYSGFRKILKKYDKITYNSLKDRYVHDVVELAYPFTAQAKDKINERIARLTDLYAKCCTHGDIHIAKQQLKLHQREKVAWERDTVWRQMIGRERRGEAGDASKAGATLVHEPEPALLILGRFRLTKRILWLLLSLAIFLTMLNVQIVSVDEANRCLAILVFCTVLWASEAIPLFVTSLLVPLLVVCLRVIRNSESQAGLSAPDATKYIFSVMFSPTIMLLIGGFTISSGLSKTNIDRVLITRVLSLAGSKPRTVLLAFMCVSCFASMWISNVAAPTLCFTLIKPILRTLPPKSAFAPCLILGIALAANIGGQSSPISSPQNLIALQEMDPALDWGKWFAVALPVSAISILLIWGLLLASYRPARSPDGEGDIEIRTIRPTQEPFTGKQYWVTFVCLVTIALWCVAHSLESVFGDMGVIALIPIIAFFGTGILKKDDFEQFAWTIVFLAMGGIALGKSVVSSGLLEVWDGLIRDMVDGFSLYTVVLILSPVVLVISTFISHTIASVLLVPIAAEVGSSLEGNPKNLLIFITALICSAGMGMPVSGFPNQTAAQQENDLGELYLTNVDFLKNGVPASILATLVVSTLGFVLMKVVGV
ncbi:Sodium/sulfate symporter [Cylindrobasidium torrendii FP15055 ss-10]|uniref:Sodium/sulfate symporter n=1 Tax=Cylindrobasidium torrendii FP15055 ss-10 TaxID=1314674 RepID=A0A0D7B768_9AGAR|nr:Sodium/sulfate symporter [Cylindrobasidium torrendii FP15055 ss-10]